MKLTTLVALILIALGVVALAYQGITYTQTRKVVDLGPIQASVEERRTIPLPPVLGGLALICGVALLVFGSRSSRAA
ncbi:MAG: DUF3185 domain-containing protein [Armatimonadota bacterium]